MSFWTSRVRETSVTEDSLGSCPDLATAAGHTRSEPALELGLAQGWGKGRTSVLFTPGTASPGVHSPHPLLINDSGQYLPGPWCIFLCIVPYYYCTNSML